MNELPPEDALFWTVLKGLQFEHNAVAYFTKIRWRDQLGMVIGSTCSQIILGNAIYPRTEYQSSFDRLNNPTSGRVIGNLNAIYKVCLALLILCVAQLVLASRVGIARTCTRRRSSTRLPLFLVFGLLFGTPAPAVET